MNKTSNLGTQKVSFLEILISVFFELFSPSSNRALLNYSSLKLINTNELKLIDGKQLKLLDFAMLGFFIQYLGGMAITILAFALISNYISPFLNESLFPQNDNENNYVFVETSQNNTPHQNAGDINVLAVSKSEKDDAEKVVNCSFSVDNSKYADSSIVIDLPQEKDLKICVSYPEEVGAVSWYVGSNLDSNVGSSDCLSINSLNNSKNVKVLTENSDGNVSGSCLLSFLPNQ